MQITKKKINKRKKLGELRSNERHASKKLKQIEILDKSIRFHTKIQFDFGVYIQKQIEISI